MTAKFLCASLNEQAKREIPQRVARPRPLPVDGYLSELRKPLEADAYRDINYTRTGTFCRLCGV